LTLDPYALPTVAEIILPLAVRSNFDYRIKPSQLDQVKPGMRVLVNFGKRRIYTGLIRRLKPASPGQPLERLKYIEALLDEDQVISDAQLDLFDWIAFYYLCTPGEVFKAALPAGLKPESALRVAMVDDLNWEALSLGDKEFLLMEALSIQPVLTLAEVVNIWDIASVQPRLQAMEARGLIRTYHEVEEKYKPKTKTYLRLAPAFTDEAQLRAAFDALDKAPAQENLFMRVVQAYYQKALLPQADTLKELGLGSGIAKALAHKGYLIQEDIQVDRLDLSGYQAEPSDITLNPDQRRALTEIQGYLQVPDPKPVLLHGVTGSGKTHVYVELMKEALAQGQQVLYLLPEITLTKQIIDRVRQALGQDVGVYHSRFNDAERVEIWQKVQQGKYQVVIGVRSSIFLPFPNLGMIVVDEEHDHSFKQHEPAPRYHARDVAVYLGVKQRLPVILGSATPAFETYRNAKLGKYHLVTMTERAISSHLPDIEVIDLRVQRKEKTYDGIFSKGLELAISETLARGEQVILFQNRRGYAPYLICENCGHAPQCINCDISLTFHKEKQHLRCHYCGHTDYNLNKCPQCAHYALRRGGIGTERITEAVRERFPDRVVERMDLDTTRGKSSYQLLINRFETGQIDILVGTQMVSKGLDFENVTLVGVILADQLLTFPDFRAYERSYQLLTQVAGRAGRRQKQGKVLIQSFMPDNVVLTSLQRTFPEFFDQELPEREQVGYPPFVRLMRVDCRHREKPFIEQESLRLDGVLRPLFGKALLGPDFALIPRVRNQYRMQFLIKLGKGIDPQQLRHALQEAIERYYERAPVRSLRIWVDVDPV
jgi:primosomal protein N' (replication factor Y)